MLAVYRQGREVFRSPAPAPPTLAGELGLFEDVERLTDSLAKFGNAVRWVGIGVLALAGGVLLFKVTELVLD